MMDGMSNKTPRMSDRLLRGTIRVSGGKNVATGLMIPVKPAKNPTRGAQESRKVIGQRSQRQTSAAGEDLIGQKDGGGVLGSSRERIW